MFEIRFHLNVHVVHKLSWNVKIDIIDHNFIICHPMHTFYSARQIMQFFVNSNALFYRNKYFGISFHFNVHLVHKVSWNVKVDTIDHNF